MIYQTLAKVFLICSGGATKYYPIRGCLFGDLPPRIENDGRNTSHPDPVAVTGSGRRDRSRECDRIHPRQRRPSLACQRLSTRYRPPCISSCCKSSISATPGLPRKAKAGTAPWHESSGLNPSHRRQQLVAAVIGVELSATLALDRRTARRGRSALRDAEGTTQAVGALAALPAAKAALVALMQTTSNAAAAISIVNLMASLPFWRHAFPSRALAPGY